MALSTCQGRDCTPSLTRRSLLAAAIVAGSGQRGIASGDEPGKAADDAHLQDGVETRARSAGLGPLQVSKSANYTAIGDAPEVFRQNALAAFEDVALDYLDYYHGQGFRVQRPTQRMVVVTLADRQSFLRYLGMDVSDQVVGFYDRQHNELVIYDNRARTERKAVPRPRFVNQITLAHEATHQLTYNTGLLNRVGDAPGCVVEGLALFGEVRKTTGRTAPGLLNQDRLRDLAYMQRRGNAWISLSSLLVEDRNSGSFKAGTDDQRSLYYSQSWLFVYFLLKDPARLPGFRAFLKAIFERTESSHRLDDARTHLGDLDQLDSELRGYSIRLLKGR
ncbi:MAG TPA: DUF1570 domain-containing protein [Isosphaeraceae bacterium]|jgi:hypothetical protein|nr:DUF1570 domain-containing protein [Isosphaeraceae bacterium]